MQPSSSNGLRGYSDFFASGLRAVTTRRPQPTAAATSASSRRSSTDAFSFATSSSSRRSFIQPRTRPASMIVHSPTPPHHSDSSGSGSVAGTPKHSRRSSFLSFSTRLFDRMASSVSYADDSVVSSTSRRRTRIFHSSSDSMPEVWISSGGPSAPNGSTGRHYSIDPFTSSPDARSMFIDLSSDSTPTSVSRSTSRSDKSNSSRRNSSTGTHSRDGKRESFLSLTGSSTRSSRPISMLFTRRERPTSIHTMPLPSRSRRSSLQYPPPRVVGGGAAGGAGSPTQQGIQEKSDFFWIVEEEPNTSGVDSILEDHEEWDAPAKIDWHQFHIDILTTDDAAQ